MYTQAQINDLTKTIAEQLFLKPTIVAYSTIGDAVTNWFKQNPVKPYVVGLTDNQVTDLCGFLFRSNGEKYYLITQWLKTQTFEQPTTLPNVHETVIGLNARQFKHILMNTRPIGDFKLSEYLDSQKFDNELLHKFDADWDNAPANANGYIVLERWYDKNGTRVGGNTLYKEQRQTNLITVNGFEVEDGCKDWKDGELMFVVSLESDQLFKIVLYSHEVYANAINKGIAYKTELGAMARAKAMLSQNPND